MKFKLTIQPPATITDEAEQGAFRVQAETLETLLRAEYDLVDESFLAGVTLGELYQDSELKEISLRVFGSDWPGMVEKLSELWLKGNGPCPECGCDQYRTIDGAMTWNDDTDQWGQKTSFACENCKTEYDELT